ncbi:MAG: tetratricopeptide repeat protein [Phycisphaerae bacterium]|jgi:tetratricopeptide (TPR) repeat protein
MRVRLAALLLVLFSATLGRAAGITPERQREILREALQALDQAVAVTRDNPAAAEQQYRQAAACFETLAAAGLGNAAIEFNLGNTYFRLGQSGKAILHYRRAARLDPANSQLLANLAFARRQVEPQIEPTGQRRLWRQLMFWHYATSPVARFRAAAGASILGWLLLVCWLRWRMRPLAVTGAVAVGIGLICAASVAWQLHDESHTPPAVIVGTEQTLRLGRGETYEPALRQPLGAGVEVRILQQRAGWAEVRLTNDQTGWLPATSLERI